MASNNGASLPSSSPGASKSSPRNRNGWDGKLRVGKKLEPAEANGDSASESENEDAQNEGAQNDSKTGQITATVMPQMIDVPGGVIDADEDLLEDVEESETDVDLNHSRIMSIPALRLDRLKSLERLCLRQNDIATISFPESWTSAHTLEDLDLYDNGIAHIKGLDELSELTTLDLSFNAIKHIKRINHLTKLKDLFLVQNKISKIEGLESLIQLTNLELGGNRIREIENLDSLVNLTELYLGKNKITELKNLGALQNLSLLSIQSNRLTSPSLSHLSTLPHLTELYISHNALDSLAPLAGCISLKTIDVSSNPITSLKGLEPLSELEEVWASSCQLGSFEEIESVLGDKQNLETVYFEESNKLMPHSFGLIENALPNEQPKPGQVRQHGGSLATLMKVTGRIDNLKVLNVPLILRASIQLGAMR